MTEQTPGPIGPIEPSAETRAGALSIRQMYVALLEVGFTEQQAMTIVGTAIAAGLRNEGS